MKNLNKIDKELLNVCALSENEKVNCIAYVNSFLSAKKYFEKSGSVVAEFPFIKALALNVKSKDVFALCSKPWLKFLSKETSAMALMNIARQVLGVDASTGKDVTICYIDTGISSHIDFVLGKNRIIKFLDLINGRSKNYDDNGHGTFVAGVGSGNGLLSGGKFKGIASDSNIVSIKALNELGEASAVKILQAMQWVFDNHKKYNIKVVCMSFGSEPLGLNDPIMKGAEALWEKGIVVVAAAGNSGPEFETIKSPGVSSKIITVGGLNDNRIDDKTYNKNFFEIADFSSRGPALRRYKPDLVAPAVNINSCGINSFYDNLSGTSVATPMIAGVCALMLEKNSKLSPDIIKHKLINSASAITFNRNLEGSGLPDFSKILY
ncbi:MAG: S8 family peptidase [Clostridia bacterium]|nr:S8 family peptidase [Clostridia bacterium]